ncbi:MAG TPA: DUF1566 domain-containing protein [Polyangiales bacterium]|nr:DUF1566 domain-containing protein [Polyangiales bacterium]
MDGLRDYSCVCNKGYEGTGKKECTNKDDCSPNPCGAFTSGCVDGVNDYTCTCAPGFANTDPKTCSNVNECAEANACSSSPEYPCRDDQPFYYCVGQFLASPMPDRTIGAAKALQYDFEPDTLFDKVTSLRWQRELPAVYPKCSGNITAMGDSCKWEEAKVYCEELVLGGFTEWRLPSKIELESLLDLTRNGMAMPDALPALPATPPSGFWSGSAYSLEKDRHWYVDFREGWSYHGSNEFEPARVRCVR